jgi:hypothetical protein
VYYETGNSFISVEEAAVSGAGIESTLPHRYGIYGRSKKVVPLRSLKAGVLSRPSFAPKRRSDSVKSSSVTSCRKWLFFGVG